MGIEETIITLQREAERYYNEKRYPEALAAIDKSLIIDDNIAEAWYDKGLILQSMGRPEEAIESYKISIELKPYQSEPWNCIGIILEEAGKPEEAVKFYDRTIEIDPSHSRAWNNKGNSLSNIGLEMEAIECFEKAIEIDPRYASPWSNKGNSLVEMGRAEEALKCIERSLDLDPLIENAWNHKGNALHDLGRADEALTCFERALEINPRFENAWVNKGTALFEKKMYRDAITCCEKALEINSKCGGAWSVKGAIHATIGEYEKAISCMLKGIYYEKNKKEPQHVKYMENLTRTFRDKNDISNSLDILEQGLSGELKSITSYAVFAFLRYAKSVSRNQNLDRRIFELILSDPEIKESETGNYENIGHSRNMVSSTRIHVANPISTEEYILKISSQEAGIGLLENPLKKEYIIERMLSGIVTEQKLPIVDPPLVYIEKDGISLLAKKKIVLPTLKRFEDVADKGQIQAIATMATMNQARIHQLTRRHIQRSGEDRYVMVPDDDGKAILKQEIPLFSYIGNLERRFLSRIRVGQEKKLRFIEEYGRSLDTESNMKFEYLIQADANACNTLINGQIFDWEMACIGNPIHDHVHLVSNIDFQDLDKKELLNAYSSELQRCGMPFPEIQKLHRTYADNLEHILICKAGSNLNQAEQQRSNTEAYAKQIERAWLYVERAIQLMEERGHTKLTDIFVQMLKDDGRIKINLE